MMVPRCYWFAAIFIASTARAIPVAPTAEEILRFEAAVTNSSFIKNLISITSNRDSWSDQQWRIQAACSTASTLLSATTNSTSIAALADENWSQACWLTPNCAIAPKSTEEVSLAMRIITFFDVPFAVRSGGHSPNPNFSSIDDGILVALDYLNEITPNSNHSTVTVGPAQRWDVVYDALDPLGITVIGGRVPTVGVGGLVLGGGLSFFTNEHGLACDNVASFEVVLANSEIVRATANENTDLFWALKGGVSNFGIVTKYELYAIPASPFYYEGILYSIENTSAILDAVVEFQRVGELDKKATISLACSASGTFLAFIYNEAVSERPAAFDAFKNIPIIATILPPQNGTLSSLLNSAGAILTNTAKRHDYRAVSTEIDAQLYQDAYSFYLPVANEINKATGANMSFTIQTISESATRKREQTGGNALGYPEHAHQWFTMLIDWNGEENDESVRNAAKSVTDNWAKLSRERNLAVDFIYTNDASRDEDPISTYGSANIAKLKDVSAKYDPKGVFQNLQNGGFLLSRSNI